TLGDAGRLSKHRLLLENETFTRPAPLNASRLFPLRTGPGLWAVATEKNKLLRLGGRDPPADWIRLRGLARQLLHFLATRTAAELSDPEEASQNRAGETLRADRRAGRRVPDFTATLRSLHRAEPDRADDLERGAGAQLHPKFPAGPRPRAVRGGPFQHHAGARAYS